MMRRTEILLLKDIASNMQPGFIPHFLISTKLDINVRMRDLGKCSVKQPISDIGVVGLKEILTQLARRQIAVRIEESIPII